MIHLYLFDQYCLHLFHYSLMLDLPRIWEFQLLNYIHYFLLYFLYQLLFLDLFLGLFLNYIFDFFGLILIDYQYLIIKGNYYF